MIVDSENETIVLTIDGAKFRNLEGFYEEVSKNLIPTQLWGRNLDAFNDILRGGFGTPAEGFEFKWLHSEVSRTRLGGDLFDTLADIIRSHGPGGDQAGDGVVLNLA